MRLEIVRNPSKFLGLESSWERLTTALGQSNPYLSFAWQRGVYEHFFKDRGDLAIALATDGTRVRGILPLIRTRRPGPFGVGVRQLQLLAEPVLAMTGLGAIGDGEAQELLWKDGLREVGRLLPHDELVLTGLWRCPLGSSALHPLDVNPVFDLPSDWDACFNGFSANKRKELRRRERDLRKLGNLELEVATSAEDVTKLFPTLERLNRERFEIAGIAGGLARSEFRSFHREIAPKLAERGIVRLFMLRASDEPIATLYVLVNGDRYLAYLGGHAAAFDRYGPGTLIDSFMIRHGITVDKVKAIDFGPGAQGYKLRFEPRLVPVMEHRNPRATVVGVALAGHRALRARRAKKGSTGSPPARSVAAPEAAWPTP